MTDQSQELLIALKKISEWADFQKKITKWSLLSLIPFLALGIGVSLYFDKTLKDISRSEPESSDWYDVSSAETKGDFEKALSIANELLERTPLYFDGHYRKGEILLALGNRGGALESFRKAEEIFPIPKHREAVEALSK